VILRLVILRLVIRIMVGEKTNLAHKLPEFEPSSLTSSLTSSLAGVRLQRLAGYNIGHEHLTALDVKEF
jgi:hypothetical protein